MQLDAAQIVSIENKAHADKHPVIRWQVTSLCNYNCDFCIQGSREAHIIAAKNESLEKRQMICDALARLIETRFADAPLIDVFLIGGEVSILHDFPLILEKLVRCAVPGTMRVYITTNFSMPVQTYVDMCKAFVDSSVSNRLFRILISYYEAYTTEKELEMKVEALADAVGIKRSPIALALKRAKRRGRRILGIAPLQAPVEISIGYPILSDAGYASFQHFKNGAIAQICSVNPIYVRNYPVVLPEDTRKNLTSRKSENCSSPAQTA